MVAATMTLAAMLAVAPWSLAESEATQPPDAALPAQPKPRPVGMHVIQPPARTSMGQPHPKAKSLLTLQPDLSPIGSTQAQADSKPSIPVGSSTAASQQAQKSPMKQAEAALANIDRLRFGSKHVAAQLGQHSHATSQTESETRKGRVRDTGLVRKVCRVSCDGCARTALTAQRGRPASRGSDML